MANQNSGGKLERVNLMISREESAWLDRLAAEIQSRTGAKVSRSEIVRAALATMQELHRQGDAIGFGSLSACKSGAHLGQLGVMAIRAAAK
jgi:hypothetical protein